MAFGAWVSKKMRGAEGSYYDITIGYRYRQDPFEHVTELETEYIEVRSNKSSAHFSYKADYCLTQSGSSRAIKTMTLTVNGGKTVKIDTPNQRQSFKHNLSDGKVSNTTAQVQWMLHLKLGEKQKAEGFPNNEGWQTLAKVTDLVPAIDVAKPDCRLKVEAGYTKIKATVTTKYAGYIWVRVPYKEMAWTFVGEVGRGGGTKSIVFTDLNEKNLNRATSVQAYVLRSYNNIKSGATEEICTLKKVDPPKFGPYYLRTTQVGLDRATIKLEGTGMDYKFYDYKSVIEGMQGRMWLTIKEKGKSAERNFDVSITEIRKGFTVTHLKPNTSYTMVLTIWSPVHSMEKKSAVKEFKTNTPPKVVTPVAQKKTTVRVKTQAGWVYGDLHVRTANGWQLGEMYYKVSLIGWQKGK